MNCTKFISCLDCIRNLCYFFVYSNSTNVCVNNPKSIRGIISTRIDPGLDCPLEPLPLPPASFSVDPPTTSYPSWLLGELHKKFASSKIFCMHHQITSF